MLAEVVTVPSRPFVTAPCTHDCKCKHMTHALMKDQMPPDYMWSWHSRCVALIDTCGGRILLLLKLMSNGQSLQLGVRCPWNFSTPLFVLFECCVLYKTNFDIMAIANEAKILNYDCISYCILYFHLYT